MWMGEAETVKMPRLVIAESPSLFSIAYTFLEKRGRFRWDWISQNFVSKSEWESLGFLLI